MNEDYLWDGSGEPDPEIVRFEQTLQGLRWSGTVPHVESHVPLNRWYQKRICQLAVAAALVVGVGTAFWMSNGQSTSWQVSIAGQKPAVMRSGQVIETGATGAKMESEFIGEVSIDPDSRLRLLSSRQDQNRLALDHGTIHALIWAPPTKFVVDTPAAKTVDLGCEYTLSVAKDGKGFLTVETGWVAFQWKKIESFIPEGAACSTRVGHGPDTPYFLDAPKALTKSLAEFDQTGSDQALQTVLTVARPQDALTLWHLLERTQGAEREKVFDRFAGLVHLPPSVTRTNILQSDRKSMDAAWDALQLGDTSWWREWKRDW